MLRNYTISNEVVTIDVKRDLGKLINKWVTDSRMTYKQTGVIAPEQYTRWKDITAIVGLNTALNVSVNPSANAFATINISPNHTIMANYTDEVKKIINARGNLPAFLRSAKDLIEIDLSKPYISGILPREFVVCFEITTGMWDYKSGYTDEEVTAVLLHEIGHAMNVYLTIGECVFANYFMTEGADILLGNTKNTLKFEVLDLQWVKKNGKPGDAEALIAEPTPENAKRVILSNTVTNIRDALFTDNASSWKRDEQLADQFASRMGYGRAMASAVHKMQKDLKPELLAIMNGIQLAFTVFRVPGYIVSIFTGQSNHTIGTYDKPDMRLKRVRLDLIAQLKYIRDGSVKEQIAKDIAVIDDLLIDIQQNTLFYDKLDEIIYPRLRRSTSHLKNEETLQELFHNQLFVDAFNFKTQGSKK